MTQTLKFFIAGLCWSGGVFGSEALAQSRVHVDEILISGRFLYQAADTVGSEDLSMKLFSGTMFDLWPNGALKSECFIDEGQWGFNCIEWHPNGQIRSEEVFDPPHVLWNGWYLNGAVFFQKKFAFEEPAGAFIGVGEELESICFTLTGDPMPCPEEVLWPGEEDEDLGE